MRRIHCDANASITVSRSVAAYRQHRAGNRITDAMGCGTKQSVQPFAPFCFDNHQFCVDCFSPVDDRLKRLVHRDSRRPISDCVGPGRLIRVRFSVELCRVRLSRSRRIPASEFDDMELGAAEFSDFICDIPNPTAFPAGLQGDQHIGGIHPVTDPSG